MKRLSIYFAAITMFFASQLLLATSASQDVAPLAQLKQASAKMVQMLHKNKSRIQHDRDFLESEIKEIVMPHFALNNMSRAVVGRNAWSKASKDQKEAFKKEFTTLVLQIYSAPLATYDDDEIKFFPLRAKGKNSNVVVRSLIVRKTGQRIPVTYNMINVKGKWYVKDFSIEGISMIESYRSQFAETLSQSNFSGLLKQIKAHNKKNA